MASATVDSRPSRRERRRREVHQRIIDAGIALFEQKGFAATTALEIADSADVAEKTFYNHFPTKQHLIEELAERSLDETARLLAEARQFPGTTDERFRRFCELTADGAERSSRQFTREVLLEFVRVAQVDGVGPDRARRLHVAFHALLEDGLARGDVEPGQNLEFYAELAVATYLGILINWVTLPNYPLRDRLLQLTDVARTTLTRRSTTTKGPK